MYIMKKFRYIKGWMFALLGSLFLLSCDRSYKSTIASENPAGLEVKVTGTSGAVTADAAVKVYVSQTDWNAEGTPKLQKQTGANGYATFTAEELGAPGIYYLIVSKGAQKVKAQTKYLLLTDGLTLQTVTLP